jgi:KDO2-lipid IV(A) lauroyltransferase
MPHSISKLRQFLAPRYWGIWCIIALFWLFTRLPYQMMLRLGAGLALLASKLSPKNAAIMNRNLALCFPKLSPTERQKIAKDCWKAHGMGVMETVYLCWGNLTKLKNRLEVKGLEHLEENLKNGRGIMLLSAHMTSLDLGGLMCSTVASPVSTTAKHQRNPLVDCLINRARYRYLKYVLFAEDLKRVNHLLKDGSIIFFAFDQDYGIKGSVFAPFFGVPTATTTTVARIAKSTNSIAIPAFLARLPRGRYLLEFQPPLTNYPSDDPIADATQYNAAIENVVRRYPDQYGWTYKRFSTRPEGEPPRYS